MTARFRARSIVLGVLASAAARIAGAQPSEAGLTTVDPRAAGVVISPEVRPKPPSNAESTHVFDAYRAYADAMVSQRRAGSVGSLLVGGTFIGVGAISHAEWDDGFGTALMIAGGVVAGAGVLTLVMPTEAENVADTYAVSTTTQPSVEQEKALEADWEQLANKARTARTIGAGITFVLAAAALGGGIYAMASDNIEEDTKRWLVPTLLLSGGATAAGGVTLLMVETPTESAYAAFLATRGKSGRPETSQSSNLRFTAAPLQRGGWGGFAMDF